MNRPVLSFSPGALLIAALVSAQVQSAPVWSSGGHAGAVGSVDYSPDGRLIVSASDDATVKLWSTNGALLRTLSTHPYQATAVAFSPDGTKLAVGVYGGGYYGGINGLGRIHLWQTAGDWTTNATLARTMTNLVGKITTLAFSADGLQLVAGNSGGSNIVRQVSNGAMVVARPAFTSAYPAGVNSVAFSSGGLLASGCEDKTLRAWNSSWTQVFNTTSAHSSNVTAVAFSPNGGLLASASLDQTIRIWSTTNWLAIGGPLSQTSGVTTIAFSPDGNTLAAGSENGIIKLWNVSAGTCRATIIAHADSVASLEFSPDGTRFVSGGQDHALKMWSAADGSLVRVLGGRTDPVRAVAVSPDGTLCASATSDNAIEIRRLADGVLMNALAGHTSCVSGVAFAPNSAQLASAGGPLDPTIKIWRLSDGALQQTITAGTNGVTALAFSADGTLLASGGDYDERVIRLWRTVDGSLAQTLTGHPNGVTALAFSPHGDLLASSGRRFDHTIKIWALTNHSLVRTFTGHTKNVEAVAFSPDGDTVASGSSGTNSLIVWRVSDGSSRILGTGTNPVFFVAFSPDGSTLASADQDTIKLWNVAAGTLSDTLTQELFQVSTLAYSPNGNLLLCGRADATLVLATNALGALGRPPLVFNSISAGPDTPAVLNAAVQPQTHYVIQSSGDLADWAFLTLGVSETNSLAVLDSTTNAAPARFYRAITPP